MSGVDSGTRKKVFSRDGYRCHYCKLKVQDDLPHMHPRRASIDHKKPRSKGGSNRIDNLLTACCNCNSDKANMAYDVYRWFRHMIMRGYNRHELLQAISEFEKCQSGETADAADLKSAVH